ncbi:MAG: UDP-N-acetylmuramate--L-alanine ligase [Thermodesulfovibrionales bacterium]
MRIFFSGIAGSGVSAIAAFSALQGNSVCGSDRHFDRVPCHPLRSVLERSGIVIAPQDGSGIDRSFDLAVFSTAVEHSNPDFIRAAEIGLPLKTRPQYLAEIVASHRTVAVAGTSGKSTMSGMLAFLLHALGLPVGFIGGGNVKRFRSASNAGNFISTPDTGGLLVVEACESDGTIVGYRPAHSIIANLDLDHHAVDETAAMFETLARQTTGLVIANADDANLGRCDLGTTVMFSIGRPSRYQAVGIRPGGFGSVFSVRGQEFRISIPGRHNVENALACIAFLSEYGIPLADVSRVLPEFDGIERRFDIHLDNGRFLVVDDYAHNPHKIGSLMKTMQALRKRVCYVFQPHGFGPTRMMKDGYVSVFSENLRPADRLAVLPIYYAGGTAAQDISASDIADPVRASGKDALAAGRSDVAGFDPSLFDAYVVFGARDGTLSDFARELAARLA